MPKIIILRGKSTAGKTTLSHELSKVLSDSIFIDIWKIKEMFEPLKLKDRTITNKASKKGVTAILKIILKQLPKNIILQETTQSNLKKHLRNYLADYQIYSFYLDVDLKTAIKRDIIRKKPTTYIGKLYKTEKEWSKNQPQPEKNDIIIQTHKASKKKILDFILATINEKRSQSKYTVRKCL